MADHPDVEASAQKLATWIEASSLREQLAAIKLALTTSPVRKRLFWAAIGIVAVIVATSVGQVLLNRWNQPFFDALARRDMPAFLHQLLVFAAIASGLLLFNVGQTWLDQMLRLKLREALTLDLIDEWMRPA
ncbi:MAG: ABC transporter ATP-binding protein/permease, partial [Mesorhizobium sp.]